LRRVRFLWEKEVPRYSLPVTTEENENFLTHTFNPVYLSENLDFRSFRDLKYGVEFVGTTLTHQSDAFYNQNPLNVSSNVDRWLSSIAIGFLGNLDSIRMPPTESVLIPIFESFEPDRKHPAGHRYFEIKLNSVSKILEDLILIGIRLTKNDPEMDKGKSILASLLEVQPTSWVAMLVPLESPIDHELETLKTALLSHSNLDDPVLFGDRLSERIQNFLAVRQKLSL
jgi:hypothetical protein